MLNRNLQTNRQSMVFIRRMILLSILLLSIITIFSLSASASPLTITNGIQFRDTSGNLIQAHGGGILQDGGYYYWFGENRTTDNLFKEVSVYRSTDLVNWEYRGAALSQSSASELNSAKIERPKVIYNATTGKYVMWMHKENDSDYSEARAAVASSSTPEGPYTYHGSFRPFDTYMSRDITLFNDNGTAYMISAANNNYDLHIYQLTPDYLDVSTLVGNFWAGGHREAPAMFKRGNIYFMLTSGATGWSPNQAKYATASSISGPWSGWTNVGDSTTYGSQPTYVLPIQGTQTTSYLYLGDRWAGAWGGRVNESPYVWQPLSFPTSTSMSMSWADEVTIDVSTGEVTGSVLSAPTAPTPESEPILRYQFEGNANDSSGNGQHGQLFYDPTFVSVDQGQAIDMDGSNDYVSLPAGVVYGLYDFSFSGWVKLDSSANTMRIFDFGYGTSKYMVFTPSGVTGVIEYTITTSGSGGSQRVRGSSPLPTGVWKHVAVTRSGNTNTIYVDGAQVAQNSNVTLSPTDLGVTPANWFGKSMWSSDTYFDGQYDDFRFYNRALSSSEVASLFYSGGPISNPTFSLTLQAEDATLSGGVVEASNHAGYNGSGFADYPWGTGSGVKVTWSFNVPVSGSYDVVVRYANGSSSARPLNLYVNGSQVQTMNFTSTGSWTNYATVTAAGVSLNAGSNTLELVANAGSLGPNIDEMSVNSN